MLIKTLTHKMLQRIQYWRYRLTYWRSTFAVQILTSFAWAMTMIISLVMMSQSMRFIDLLSLSHVSYKQFLLFVLCLVPDLMITLSPLCALWASIIVTEKLCSQKHDLIYQILGVDYLALYVGVLRGAFVLSVLLFALSTQTHKLFQVFRSQEMHWRTSAIMSCIKPRKITQVGRQAFYVHHKRNDALRYILYSHDKDDKGFFMIGKNAHMAYRTQKDRSPGGVIIKIQEGRRYPLYAINPQNFPSFSFVEYAVFLPTYTPHRVRKIYEHDLRTLMNPSPTLASNIRQLHQREAFGKIWNPLCVMIMMALGACASLSLQRGRYVIKSSKKHILHYACWVGGALCIQYFMLSQGRYFSFNIAMLVNVLIMGGVLISCGLYIRRTHRL